VTALSVSAQAACDSIIAQADAWVTLAAAIESLRRSGKVAVEAAASAQAILTARDNAVAALEAV
jgi:hypothetical protein